ncbi:hypothetical protein PI124_g1216 [Phytophthora idaei]|nr:hypothetical protein PI125_g1986 [Phytophthora idaei]KAG3169280.1 hypothetical protein PI126_g2901 [Phytophthora idaei]KAG3254199.1 hypothetical protein PI124_g1216 [Phytophthora idaei]
MVKHARAAITNQASDLPPTKVAKVFSVCEYCDKQFTTRGIPLHQKKCVKKQAHDKAEAKKTRSYNFCILNEAIYEEILSFLNNQTLTKMQMITGDRYQQCEPVLARYCCKCESDNPVIRHSFCRLCLSSSSYCINGRITKRVAKAKYGMRGEDFSSIDFPKSYPYYSCQTLEDHMIKTIGSKREWLRHLVKRDLRKKKALATRILNRKTKGFLQTLAPGFAAYVSDIRFMKTDKEVLERCSERFVTLRAKLRENGLSLRADSSSCKVFITTGMGSVEDVVDSIAGSSD